MFTETLYKNEVILPRKTNMSTSLYSQYIPLDTPSQSLIYKSDDKALA